MQTRTGLTGLIGPGATSALVPRSCLFLPRARTRPKRIIGIHAPSNIYLVLNTVHAPFSSRLACHCCMHVARRLATPKGTRVCYSSFRGRHQLPPLFCSTLKVHVRTFPTQLPVPARFGSCLALPWVSLPLARLPSRSLGLADKGTSRAQRTKEHFQDVGHD